MPYSHLTRYILLIAGFFLSLSQPVNAVIDTDLIVAIDIGHSPKRHGATSARGIGEYTFNARIARLLHTQLLDVGFENAFIVTEQNPEMPLMSRASLAGARQADLLISIHHDSVQPHYLSMWEYNDKQHHYSDKFQGFSLFVSTENREFETSRHFADLLGEQFLANGLTPTLHHAEQIKGESRPLLDSEKGIYQYDNLAILRHSKMPAVLVECGIIVNRQEEERLNSPFYQQTLVAGILRAILKYARTERTPAAPIIPVPAALETTTHHKQTSSPLTSPVQALPQATD